MEINWVVPNGPDLIQYGQSMMCRLLGHSTYWAIRIQPNPRVVKRDETCSRCGAVVGTLTWPNLNWRSEYADTTPENNPFESDAAQTFGLKEP